MRACLLAALITSAAHAESARVALVPQILDALETHMAGFKTPKTVVFGPLPKTSTGKIQKFMLREKVKEL